MNLGRNFDIQSNLLADVGEIMASELNNGCGFEQNRCLKFVHMTSFQLPGLNAKSISELRQPNYRTHLITDSEL